MLCILVIYKIIDFIIRFWFGYFSYRFSRVIKVVVLGVCSCIKYVVGKSIIYVSKVVNEEGKCCNFRNCIFE